MRGLLPRVLPARLGLPFDDAVFHQEAASAPHLRKGLLLAAEQNHMSLVGVSAVTIRELGPFVPCIIHLQGEHFVLLEAILEKGAVVVDPRSGRKTAGTKERASFFSGPAFILRRYAPFLDSFTDA